MDFSEERFRAIQAWLDEIRKSSRTNKKFIVEDGCDEDDSEMYSDDVDCYCE